MLAPVALVKAVSVNYLVNGTSSGTRTVSCLLAAPSPAVIESVKKFTSGTATNASVVVVWQVGYVSYQIILIGFKLASN